MVKYFWRKRIWKNSSLKNIGKKINKIKLIDAKNIDNKIIQDLNNFDCLIIDSF